MTDIRAIIDATWCHHCESVAEPITVDNGNYEECWGAKVWREEWEASCPLCGKDDLEDVKVYEDDYSLAEPIE